MFTTKYKILPAAIALLWIAFAISSCVDNLNTSPLDDDIVTSEAVYNTPEDYRQVLAKLYSGFAATGQQGPAGNPDIQGIDEGFSSYVRMYWVSQEIPTDEAVVGWTDPGLPEFNYHTWGASNDFVMGMYSRIYYEIALTNEFIRNAQGHENETIQTYNAEARFLRALSYWHALDLYRGGIPFVTEEDGVGAYNPEPISSEDLFSYIESELLDIIGELPDSDIAGELIDAGQAEYGHADKAAAWMLLAKLYLNAEIYIGEQHYDDALTYADRVIEDGGYILDDNYGHLFLADNHTADGIIFPITFDGDNTKTFGGTSFIIHAAIGGDMSAAEFGVDGGWEGHRVTPQFVDKFSDGEQFSGFTTDNSGGDPEIYVPGGYQAASGYDTDWEPADAPPLVSENSDDVYVGFVYFAEAAAEYKFTNERNWNDGDWGDNEGDGTLEAGGGNLVIQNSGLHRIEVNLNDMTYQIDYAGDSRQTFFTGGQSKEIENISDFNQGYAVTKWKNVTSDGQPGPVPEFPDTDFPMFRLADAYLMYAEAHIRGGGGSESKAVSLINELRERAYGNSSANISAGDLSADMILDERARELHWEAHRRTDLIRHGVFTGSEYVWSFKGEDPDGASTSDIYNVFPIPASEINSNTNLTQNEGY